MQNDFAIGIDIGGTKLEVGLVDSFGNIHDRLIMASDVKNGPEAIENQIREAVSKLINYNKGKKPSGFGIGVAGQVEAMTGNVKYAPNLNWYDVPLLFNLQESLQLPGVVTNDVRAAAWGEWLYGAGKNCKDLVCLFVGTGIGGGVVSGGKMLSGYSNTGGELGHITVQMDGPECTCGNKGCMEAFAGGWAIAKRAKEMLTDGFTNSQILKLSGHCINSITAQTVIEAYRAGDRLATEIIRDAEAALIAGATSIVNAFNPSRIILGGGILKGLPELVSIIEEGIKRNALSAATNDIKVVPAKIINNSGVIGAAAIAIHAFGHGRFSKTEILDLTA
jgi:glucokinase